MRVAYLVVAGLFAAIAGKAEAETDFNPYILKAVDQLYPKYRLGGYNKSKVYTHDIVYGASIIKKSATGPAPAPSMCVATMAEVIATALNIYRQEHLAAHAHNIATPVPADDVTDRIKAENFVRSSRLTLRGNLFMLAGTGSLGTAWTLERFGLGKQLPFSALKPGDFVNLNRTSKKGKPSGHAVVFLGFINSKGDLRPANSADIRGFKYFSDQGMGKPDAGLGYRYGFFSPTCPTLPKGKVRDCNIIYSTKNPAILNTGRMLAPSQWTYEQKVLSLRNEISRSIAASQGISRAAADNLVDAPLPEEIPAKFDGVDGD